MLSGKWIHFMSSLHYGLYECPMLRAVVAGAVVLQWNLVQFILYSSPVSTCPVFTEPLMQTLVYGGQWPARWPLWTRSSLSQYIVLNKWKIHFQILKGLLKHLVLYYRDTQISITNWMPLLQLFQLGCQVFWSFLLLAMHLFSAAYHTFFRFTSIFAATATPHPKTKPSPVRIFVGCGMEGSPLEFEMVSTLLFI